MMDDLPTTAATSGYELFAPEETVDSLLVKAYQGEVSGEALFGTLAEHTQDDDHQRKLVTLRLLETRTKNALVPAMRRNDLPIEPDPPVVRDAEVRATKAASLSWSDFLGFFEPITTQYIALYDRIRELADGDDHAAAQLLVAHEKALREFSRRELAGRSDESLDHITALPHMQ